MYHFRPLKHINLGAVTGICFVALALVFVIIRLSLINYKAEPSSNASNSSPSVNIQTKSSAAFADLRRDAGMGKASAIQQPDIYKFSPSAYLSQRQSNVDIYNRSETGDAALNSSFTGTGSEDRTKMSSKPSLTLSDLAVARLIVAASIADYTGSCACPYHRSRNGISCANKSAYSRGGSQLCYVTDVSSEMIKEYREIH